MRVLPENFMPPAFTPSQRAFVDAWFSLTHAQSLDSHRVRTLNARLVLRELVDVCRLAEAGVISTFHRKAVAEEALSVLDRDPVFASKFADHLRVLKRMLRNPEYVDGKPPPRAIELRIATHDVLIAIEPDYFGHIIQELRGAISGGRPSSDILQLTSTMLTDLTEQGFSIDNLSGFHSFFDATVKPGNTFDQRFDYLIGWLGKPAEEHQIVLRLSRAEKLAQIRKFGDWEFDTAVQQAGTDPVEAAFVRPGRSVVFATRIVKARDYRQAGAVALQSWSRVTDQLLFDFLDQPVPMDSRYRSVRQRDSRMDIGQVRVQVPNPREWTSHRNLQQFSQQLETVLSDDCELRDEDKRQIEAALRYLRLGAEATSLESMFLTRWIALESLLRTVAPDDPIPGVAKSVAGLMTVLYVSKLNADLCGTARFLRRPLPAACQHHAGGATDTGSVSWDEFASIVLDVANRTVFLAEFNQWPVYRCSVEHFACLLDRPKDLRAALDNHERRVQWQVQRAYRVRNEIVHSASHTVSLLSLVAHLEYYLRTTTRTIVRVLHRQDHTESLRDLFHRVASIRTRLDEDLKAAGEGKGPMPEYLLDPLALSA
jgi:hypothetical protein